MVAAANPGAKRQAALGSLILFFGQDDVYRCPAGEKLAHHFTAERLELEITETMCLKDEQACLIAIRRLKHLGIAIVRDDFGVGYSSSSYLTRAPFNKIKIDKSFVQGFPDRRECVAIIQSVLALARGLDMLVTAAGVETREQFESLRAAGVDLIQGYLFGRPLPLHQLAWSPADPQAKNVA